MVKMNEMKNEVENATQQVLQVTAAAAALGGAFAKITGLPVLATSAITAGTVLFVKGLQEL